MSRSLRPSAQFRIFDIGPTAASDGGIIIGKLIDVLALPLKAACDPAFRHFSAFSTASMIDIFLL